MRSRGVLSCLVVNKYVHPEMGPGLRIEWIISVMHPCIPIFPQVWLVAFPSISSQQELAPHAPRRVPSSSLGLLYRPESGLFSTIFPFHLVLSEDLRVVQVGPHCHPLITLSGVSFQVVCPLQVGNSLCSLVPELIAGAAVSDHLKMVVPYTG